MPRISSGATRLANRQLMLALHASEPELKATAIGRRLGINEATVRSILKRYGANSIPTAGGPAARRGAGRPTSRSKRWKRCVPALLYSSTPTTLLKKKLLPYPPTTPHSFHRALKNMVTRNPFQSLRQLAVAMLD